MLKKCHHGHSFAFIFLLNVALFALPALAEENLLFHNDFNNTAAPKFAAGSKSVQYGNKKSITYTDGIQGQAVVLGGTGDSRTWLGFQSSANFNPDTGTLSLWLKPLDWDGSKPGNFFFFQLSDPDNNGFLLYKYWEMPAIMRFLVGRHDLVNKKTNLVSPWEYIRDWKQGKWVHVAITWQKAGGTLIGKEGRAKIYINGNPGQEIALKNTDYPESFPKKFFLGNQSQWSNMLSAKTAFDELKIYSRELSAGEIKTEFLKFSTVETEKSIFAASKFKNPPVIEQSAPDSDWNRASACTALVNPKGQLSTELAQPIIKLGYDDKNLYFFIREPRQSYPLKSTADSRDGQVYLDDAYEIFVSTQQVTKNYRQLVINSKGALYDGIGMDGSWNSHAKFTSRIDPDGSWTLKIALPFSDLDVSAVHPGDTFYFNICRDIVNAGRSSASLSPNAGFFLNSTDFAQIKLLPENQTLSCLLTGDPVTGDIRLSTSADSTMTQNSSITQDSHTLKTFTHDFKSSPTSTFNHRIEKVNQPTLNQLSTTILAGSNMIFRQQIPFVMLPFVNVSFEMQPDRDEILFNLIAADPIKAKLKNARVTLQFNDPADKNVLTLTVPYRSKLPMSLKNLPAGKYTLKMTFTDPAGVSLGDTVLSFFSPKSDAWRDFSKGLNPDIVPTPWTPVTWTNQTFTCWNRTYTYDNSFLPTAITSGATQILHHPIQLTAVINGQPQNLAQGAYHVQKLSHGQSKLSADCAVANTKLSINATFDFDGYSVYSITIDKPTSAKFEKLYLDIPIKKEFAQLKYVPFLNEKGVEKTDVGSIRTYQSWPFGPGLWIGNDDLGLTWFTESDEFWYLTEKSRAIELLADSPDCVTLRINFITDPAAKLPKILHYAFGLQATPIKPFPAPKNWLRYSFVEAPNQKIYITGWGNDPKNCYQGFPAFPYPKTNEPEYNKDVQNLHSPNNRYGRPLITCHYLNPTMCVENVPEFQVFKSNWLASPPDIWGTDGPVSLPFYRVCPNSKSWSSFYTYSFDQFFPRIIDNGMYQDFGHPKSCTNASHGCGYDRSGQRHPTYPIFKYHELNKRLYIIAKQYETPNRPIFFVGHSGGSYCLPHANFYTMIVDGEYLGGVVTKAHPYLDFLTTDRMRTEFSGRQFGIIFNFIPVAGGFDKGQDNKPYTEELLTALATHGTLWGWHSFIHPDPQNRLLSAYEAFNTENVEQFLPYWKNSTYVTSSIPDVKVSLFVKTNKVLLALGNFSSTDSDTTIKLNLTALNLSAPLSARDASTNTSINISTDGKIDARINHKNFKMILVEHKPQK